MQTGGGADRVKRKGRDRQTNPESGKEAQIQRPADLEQGIGKRRSGDRREQSRGEAGRAGARPPGDAES
jgi:hypothetical protein